MLSPSTHHGYGGSNSFSSSSIASPSSSGTTTPSRFKRIVGSSSISSIIGSVSKRLGANDLGGSSTQLPPPPGTSRSDMYSPASLRGIASPIQEGIREINSSFELQMALYFNAIFSVLWFFMELGIFIWKTQTKKLDFVSTIVFPILLLVWAAAEFIRLYNGYAGNIKERVPRLVIFYLLTLVPCLPLILVYFLFFAPAVVPLDNALNIVQAIFLFAEIILGFIAIRRMVQASSKRYYLRFNEDGTMIADHEAPASSSSAAVSTRARRRSDDGAGVSPSTSEIELRDSYYTLPTITTRRF